MCFSCVHHSVSAICCEGLIDALDEQLIGYLLKDARATYAEMGLSIGLSAPAVKRRVDRLVASGAIRSFTALVDPTALGWTTEAYVELYCKGTVAPHELRRSLESIPEVIGACTVSGSADALIHMLATDVGQLERAIERVRDHPHVDHTVSVIVLSRLLDRPRSGPGNGGSRLGTTSHHAPIRPPSTP